MNDERAAFLNAATLIFSQKEDYCCMALNSMNVESSYLRYKTLLGHYFKPDEKHWNDCWFGSPMFLENQEHRVLSLLLMAEIAKDL